jgi:hypothetical protein
MGLIMATLGIFICLPIAGLGSYIMWCVLVKQWKIDFGKDSIDI